MDDGGRKKVAKLGMKLEARDGLEFEFTCVLDLIHDGHYATVSKDRTGLFAGDPKPITVETGKRIAEWLKGATPTEPQPSTPRPAPVAAEEPLFDRISRHIAEAANVRTLGRIGDRIDALTSEGQLTDEQADELRARVGRRHDAVEPAADTVN